MKDFDSLRIRANACFERRSYIDAAKIYISIAQYKPLEPEDAYQLSVSLCKLNKYEIAYPILLAIVKLNTSADKLAIVYMYLAECVLYTSNDKNIALEYINKACQCRPSSEECLYKIAAAYFALNEFKLCKICFQQARELGWAESPLFVDLEARVDFELINAEGQQKDINLSLPKKITPSKQKTILLHPGFAKCGSTFLQSYVWPNLPIERYFYLGKYYQQGISSRLERGLLPANYPQSFLRLLGKAATCDATKHQLLNFLNNKLKDNDLLCFSNEILPDVDKAIELYRLIKNLMPQVNIVHLLVVRPPLDAAWSTHAHNLLSENFSSRIQLTFEERMSNHSHIFEYSEMAQKYFDSVGGHKISTELKSLSNSKNLWNTIFASLCDMEETDQGYIEAWVKQLQSIPKINKKTGIAESLLPDSRDNISPRIKEIFGRYEENYYAQIRDLEGFVG